MTRFMESCSERLATWRTVAGGLALLLAVGSAFGVLAYASILSTQGAARVASLWLPNACAIAALLRLGLARKQEWLCRLAMLAGNIATNLAVGDAVVPGIVLALANFAEITVALALVRRMCGPRPDMAEIAELAPFMLSIGLAAPAASSVVAALVLEVGPTPGQSQVLHWFASDAMSLLILAPSILVFWDAAARPAWPRRRVLAEWAVTGILGTLVTYLVFRQTAFPLLFLVPPIVVFYAFRLGTLGTAFAVIEIAVIALLCTNAGTGPIHIVPYSAAVQFALLEAFLTSAILVGLPVAAVLATRARLARAVETAQRQLALLAANLTDAILHYDLDGRCTYASPAVRKVLGAQPHKLIGASFTDQAHPDWRPALRDALARLSSKASANERVTYRRLTDDAAGEAVWIEAGCTIVSDTRGGVSKGIVVSARDVSERVVLEHHLEQARRKAEHAARAKAQFLANMSHEIRTPMNGMLGFANLLRGEALGPAAQRHAELIARSGQSLMTLLNDILDLSKIESGNLTLTAEPFDLGELIADCAALHQASTEQRGLSLRVEYAKDLPQHIVSDPLRLRQILLNLIGNAVKFTERGHVTLTIRAEDERLAIIVADSGIGIHPHRLEHIFDPFAQEEAATSRRFGGTGLGLSISRQLAGLLGGSLTVASSPGEGSSFTLHLPLAPAGEHALPATSLPRHAHGAVPQGRRILLAEDHDINRLLAVAMLEQLGQAVTVVEDGSAAIAAALAGAPDGKPFDLVLMDIQMPGCDGYAAARAIRTAGVAAAELPIVALTANAFAEDVAAAIDAGMQGHVAKPLTFAALAQTLARWLPQEDASAALALMVAASDKRPADHGPPGAPALLLPTAGLAQRWQQRCDEALATLAHRLAESGPLAAPDEELARDLHKIAGTAELFGHPELGRHAAALERALRADGTSEAERRRLAHVLLAAA